MNQRQKQLLLILFLAGFAVRLYRIDNPVADWHSWRQADTAAVTRNFFRFGVNPFLPRYDDFSDVSGQGLLNPGGYRMVEFPLFNLIHYVLSASFSAFSLEYWGRMTSVLASLVSAGLIWVMVRRHTDYAAAFLSAGFFLFLPFNIYFSRVILPDPLMVTLYLATLNFFDLWTRNPRSKLAVLTCITGALAVLVKPAAVFFLFPVVWYYFYRHRWQVLKQKWLWIFGLSFILPYLGWRTWEARHPEGIPAAVWLFNGDHIRFKGAFFRWIFGERLAKLILGGWGTVTFAAGLMEAGYFMPWVAGAGLYLFTFATGNVRHDYYQIPIIPALSVCLGLGTAYLWRLSRSGNWKTWLRRGLLVASLGLALAFSWYDVRGNYQVNHWEIVHAGRRVDEITPADAIVIAPYNGDTAFLYQTNRRGFAYLPFPVKDLIDRFKATYYVSVNYDDQTRQIMDKYIVVEEKPEYVIVKLEEPKIPAVL